jgi:hypothetical protein
MAFKTYKSDRRKAVQSDPHSCVLAKGIRRHKDVADVYVGSGLDAYVVFKATDDDEAHAEHFIIRTSVRKIIDKFDVEKKCQSQIITLSKPTKGRTLAHRSKLNGRRNAEIKAGAKVKPGKSRRPRVDRLGVPHRPRAPISKDGNVNVQAELAL